MALQIAAVANSIAALSVSGVTIYDVDEIPTQVDKRISAIFPAYQFATDWTHERNSFGIGTVAKQTVEYTLNYRFCYKRIGAGRITEMENIDEMLDKVALFQDAIMAIDTLTGAVDIVPLSPTNMPHVEDPAGSVFIGCDLAVRVTEFIN